MEKDMSNRYESATPEELTLYQYMARVRRKELESLEQSSGMTGNVVAIHSALRRLSSALEVDEFMLNEVVNKLGLDD